ncbi:MAG TPA: AraC family transcriptional regulator, partial [Planctomycetota bacterium]|nr:AraC family transcriptional regulator [Planctomycetota bacterium]
MENIANPIERVFAWKAHHPSPLAKSLWWQPYRTSHWQCGRTYGIKRQGTHGVQIMFIVKGQGGGEYRGQAFQAGPGHAIVMDLAQPHEYHAAPADPWEMYWIVFDGPGAQATCEMLNRTAQGCVIPFASEARMQADMAALILLLTDHPPGYDAWAASHLMALVANVVEGLRRAGRQPDPELINAPTGILEALMFLRSNYRESLTLRKLAAVAHMSPFHFLRRFKDSTGFTPMDYLEKLRINRAQELIAAEPELRLKEIAARIGYSDPGYFSKVFRKCHG